LPDPPFSVALKGIARALIALIVLIAALGWLFGGRPGYPFDRVAHGPRL
jgi:hypothetical protein